MLRFGSHLASRPSSRLKISEGWYPSIEPPFHTTNYLKSFKRIYLLYERRRFDEVDLITHHWGRTYERAQFRMRQVRLVPRGDTYIDVKSVKMSLTLVIRFLGHDQSKFSMIPEWGDLWRSDIKWQGSFRVADQAQPSRYRRPFIYDQAVNKS